MLIAAHGNSLRGIVKHLEGKVYKAYEVVPSAKSPFIVYFREFAFIDNRYVTKHDL